MERRARKGERGGRSARARLRRATIVGAREAGR